LLAEAGYPNGFQVEQWTMTDRYLKDKAVSEAVNDMLRKVGIDVTLKTAEWSTYFGDYVANGKMPLYLIPSGLGVDPSAYLHQYFRTGVSRRIRGFSDPKVDELLLKEAATLDAGQRVTALREAMSAIMEAVPAVFLYLGMNNYGVSDRIDWKPNPSRNYAWGPDISLRQ
jgi:ABC-type transport system substrate-binding protein